MSKKKIPHKDGNAVSVDCTLTNKNYYQILERITKKLCDQNGTLINQILNTKLTKIAMIIVFLHKQIMKKTPNKTTAAPICLSNEQAPTPETNCIYK